MQKTEIDTKTHFKITLTNFLHKYRLPLITTLVVVAVFIVVYFTWTELQNRKRERATLLAEQAQELYLDWKNEQDTDVKQIIEGDIEKLLVRILDQYAKQYAAERAYFIRASMAYERENWQKAAESYLDLVETFPRGYLAPLGLFNAASSYEELDDSTQALALLSKLVESYDRTYLTAHALFNVGRLSETTGDFDAALAAYDLLEDEHPLSNWTKLGRNRIIDLKLKGKLKE